MINWLLRKEVTQIGGNHGSIRTSQHQVILWIAQVFEVGDWFSKNRRYVQVAFDPGVQIAPCELLYVIYAIPYQGEKLEKLVVQELEALGVTLYDGNL